MRAHTQAITLRARATALFLFAAAALPAARAAAQTAQVLDATSPAWSTAYNAFTTRTGFETLSLPADLTLTLSGGIFPSAQTYSALPALFDPSTVTGAGGFGGPYTGNLWEGAHMVTNFGYSAALPAGHNWINDWSPTTASLSSNFTFNFTGGATAVGVGLSNFQSQVTGHSLVINGAAHPLTIEAIAGSNWTDGRLVRNGYLLVTAAPGVPIYSIGITNISAADGLTFDALGYNAVPAPAAAAVLVLGIAPSIRRRRR